MKNYRILLLVPFIVQIATAQQPAPGILRGIVLQAGTTNPLAEVNVELRPAAGGPTVESITTERDGQFAFPKVAPGSYRLVATRPGYINAEYPQKQPNSPTSPITFTPGQRVENVQLNMTPGGVISGRVTDNGQPIGIVDVYALKFSENNVSVQVLSAKTNDLGEYRLFWLPPGQYYVSADIKDGAQAGPLILNTDGDNGSSIFQLRLVGRAVLNRAVGAGAADNERHVPTFFPGTIDPARATPVEVRAGAEASNININAPALPVHHIRGRVTGIPEGPAGQRPIVQILQTPYPITPYPVIQGDPDGAFDMPRVAAGTYSMFSVVGNRIGKTTVEVQDADVNGVVVTLTSGLELSGRVVVERQTAVNPDTLVASLQVGLNPEPITAAPSYGSPATPDGSFKIPSASTALGVIPGDYRVLVPPLLRLRSPIGAPLAAMPESLRNAYVKSIRLGDKDLLNNLLHIEGPLQDRIEIVVGTNPGSIEGRVLNDRQQPAASVWVALIPENSLRFRIDHKFTSSGPDGRFQIQNVPPGDYKIFAWENIEKLAWQESRIMRSYESSGTLIHVDEGKKTTVEFPVIPAPN